MVEILFLCVHCLFCCDKLQKLSLLSHANGRQWLGIEGQIFSSPGPQACFTKRSINWERQRAEGLARTVWQQGWSPGGFWEKEGADRSEPQRRQQDDNWGPERIVLTKKQLKAARIYKRMQGKITLTRARVIFKTY